ncbi:WD40-repeat-containing domain protein [Mycena olivaceomarginata]|nr:WD40-repeat-containing domain protein [Mycena olivaceomarginata]
MASGSDDETVRIWDASTGAEVMKMEGHSGLVSSVAFSPDGARVVSGSDDDTVRIWDASTGPPLPVSLRSFWQRDMWGMPVTAAERMGDGAFTVTMTQYCD